MRRAPAGAVVIGLTLALSWSCTAGPAARDQGERSSPAEAARAADPSPTEPEERSAAPPTPTATSPPPVLATEAPPWLGTRVLPPGEDGYGTVVPTPPELRDRRIRTIDRLPPPEDGFAHAIVAVPDDVLERSTWVEECPVARDELRYVTLAHWGFDGEPHTGELLVHHAVAEDLVTVFRTAWAERFPIEEMRIVTRDDLEAPPTGDGNNTTAFVCRPVRGSDRWSEHAYGLAVDVNPFHNPYVRDGIVLPELASAYTDRAWVRPGMLFRDGPVVAAFAAIGWHWGGDWTRPVDWMHFSRDGG